MKTALSWINFFAFLFAIFIVLFFIQISFAVKPGTLKWSYETEGKINYSPALDSDGTIYIGSSNKLYAFTPEGKLDWKVDLLEINTSPVIGKDGTIYIGTGGIDEDNNRLYAINPKDRSIEWRYETEHPILTSPAIGSDGTIYVSSQYKLYAISQEGEKKWDYQAGGYIEALSPTIGSDGTIYIGSHDYKLHALEPDGTLRWTYETGGWVDSPPAIGSDGTIYFGSNDNKLYAINKNGTLKWSFETGCHIASSPAIGSDGIIYVTSFDHYLYAVWPDGSLKWRYKTLDFIDRSIYSSPAIGSDGTIYVGSWAGKLYAIQPDGSLKWSYPSEEVIGSSPAIGSDGTIYVGSSDKNFYAINSDSRGLDDTPWPMFGHDLRHTSRSRPPQPQIKVNNKEGPVTVTKSEEILVTVSLDSGDRKGQMADWWIVAYTPSTEWQSWVIEPYVEWVNGIERIFEYRLVDLPSTQINTPDFSSGKNYVAFAVDKNNNGRLDATWWWDFVEVNIK
ncbi:MAG TPA: PQQ-binding-like beta-propeller repeat protein [Desulfohalobiaceae bacterium]|nr:PQQ-binding-like beta-propeller repeat protein [Desulfohalobiaceae bacterium]